MGTNFYARTKPCKTCGHAKHGGEVHIGKSSIGWMFMPGADHATLQDAAIAIGEVCAEAAASQPAFAHMDAHLRSLRQQAQRILTEHGIGETKVIREKVEEFGIHAYGGRG